MHISEEQFLWAMKKALARYYSKRRREHMKAEKMVPADRFELPTNVV
jgi:hypothetical protein